MKSALLSQICDRDIESQDLETLYKTVCPCEICGANNTFYTKVTILLLVLGSLVRNPSSRHVGNIGFVVAPLLYCPVLESYCERWLGWIYLKWQGWYCLARGIDLLLHHGHARQHARQPTRPVFCRLRCWAWHSPVPKVPSWLLHGHCNGIYYYRYYSLPWRWILPIWDFPSKRTFLTMFLVPSLLL